MGDEWWSTHRAEGDAAVPLAQLQHVLGLEAVVPAPRQQQDHALVQLGLVARVRFLARDVVVEPLAHAAQGDTDLCQRRKEKEE